MNSNILPQPTTLWKKNCFKITTAVDTEYRQNPNNPNMMITSQIAFSADPADCLVLEHPNLGLGILPTWNTKTILSTILNCEEIYDEETEPETYLLWEILMFFAPSDLLSGLFNDYELCKFIQKHCIQDVRIRIDNGSRNPFDKTKHLLKLPIFLETELYGRAQLVINVVDLGKVANGGLLTTATSLGLEMEEKSLMDNYKKNILEPYRDPKLFDIFIEYAKADANILFEIRKGNKQRTEKLFSIHDLTPPTREKITTGGLVANLFYEWISRHIGENAAYKHFTGKKGKPFELRDLLKKCSVSYFAQSNPETTKQTNALIQGGRAKNERPNVIYETGVIADADLSSCYATILEQMTYPVGIPYTYYTHESSKKKPLTLGKFLEKHEKSMLPRLYTIIVSGKLKHHQTLVPSKIVDNFKINENYEPDDPKIDADFRIYTKEIINGIITSDVLDVLRNVCNRSELKQWMNLEVISAVWYPEHKCCRDPEIWNDQIKRETEQTGNQVIIEQSKDGKVIVQDNRSRFWLPIPITDFIKPYKQKRSNLKRERSKHAADTSEYRSLDAQQNAMKLVCNTLYGVLASPYFDIGNVVVANNITAAARTAVWCLATAAGTYQSITDGGAYNLNQVRDWKDGHKPGMNTLSLWRNPTLLHRQHSSKLFTKPLASETQWGLKASDVSSDLSVVTNADGVKMTHKAEEWDYFDTELLNHIKHFFRDGSPIKILDLISFTHKDIYESVTLHSQTNYQFIHVSGKPKTKARGFKLNGTPYDNETSVSNILNLFDDLKKYPHNIPPYSQQTIAQILKCNQANRMLKAKKPNVLQQRDLLAGDTIAKQSWVRPISLSMFHWQTDEQYHSWTQKTDKLKDLYGYGVEQFFLNTDSSVDYERAINTIQNRIDEGFMWIVGKGKRSNKSNFTDHPFKDK